MALAGRVLSRSRKLYAGQLLLQHGRAISQRTYSKEGASTPRKMDEMLKGIFEDVKKKFEIAHQVLKKEKITIDPDDPKAVSQYANALKTIRKEAGLLSESQRIKFVIESNTRDIPDARTYLTTLQEIRIKNDLVDNLGAEKMMFEALEKVEKEIGKPLLRSDKKSMSLLHAEFDKINQKLGIRKEDLPKYEEQLEMKIAKDDLVDMKKEAVEAMEVQLKREEFKDEKMPDVRSLDIRNFLL